MHAGNPEASPGSWKIVSKATHGLGTIATLVTRPWHLPGSVMAPFPRARGSVLSMPSSPPSHALKKSSHLPCPKMHLPPCPLPTTKFPTCRSITHIYFAHSERLTRVRDCHLGPCPEGLASPVAWPAHCPPGMPRACHLPWTKVTEQHKKGMGMGMCFKTSFISLMAGGINIHCKRKRLEMSRV